MSYQFRTHRHASKWNLSLHSTATAATYVPFMTLWVYVCDDKRKIPTTKMKWIENHIAAVLFSSSCGEECGCGMSYVACIEYIWCRVCNVYTQTYSTPSHNNVIHMGPKDFTTCTENIWHQLIALCGNVNTIKHVNNFTHTHERVPATHRATHYIFVRHRPIETERLRANIEHTHTHTSSSQSFATTIRR